VSWLAVVVTLLGLTALGLSFSKGATLALVATGAATLVAIVAARLLRWGAWWWRTVAFGAVALVFGAVLMRGAIGEPDTAAGERSLLFRYHYLQAASRMIAEHPVEGVGPGLFKTRYLTAKNPLNPEDVSDPHSVFASYLSTLGAGGAAWAIALLLVLGHVGRAAATAPTQAAAPDDEADADQHENARHGVTPGRLAIATGVLIFGVEYAVQYAPAMGVVGLAVAAATWFVMGLGTRVMLRGFDKRKDDDADDDNAATGASDHAVGAVMWAFGGVVAMVVFPLIGVWAIAAAGFVGVTTALTYALRRVDHASWVAFGLFAAAVGLLLHSQIEMTLVQVSSAPLAMVVLGLTGAMRPATRAAGATSEAPDAPADAPPARSPMPLLATSIASLVLVGALAVAHVRPVLAHESTLADAADALRGGNIDGAIQGLTRVTLGRDIASPPDDRMAREAAQLLFEHGRVDDAYTLLEAARSLGLRPHQQWTTEARLAEVAFKHTRQPAHLVRAYDAAVGALASAPYDLERTHHAADLAWSLGALLRRQARQLYARLLDLSDQAYLDPNKPLRDAELETVRQRLAALDAAAATATPP